MKCGTTSGDGDGDMRGVRLGRPRQRGAGDVPRAGRSSDAGGLLRNLRDGMQTRDCRTQQSRPGTRSFGLASANPKMAHLEWATR